MYGAPETLQKYPKRNDSAILTANQRAFTCRFTVADGWGNARATSISQQMIASFTIGRRGKLSIPNDAADGVSAGDYYMQQCDTKVAMEIRPTPANAADAGKVRIGGESPSFGPVRVAPANTIDHGKVRIGGESPSFGPVRLAPANTIDNGKVRIGGESPSFGPVVR
jgi:hypothetical protein